MTAPLRIGVICEGSTDSVVLRAILDALCAPGKPAIIPLQPPVDKLNHIGLGGWQAVRSFLQRAAASLRRFVGDRFQDGRLSADGPANWRLPTPARLIR